MSEVLTGQTISADSFIPVYTAGENITLGDALAHDLSDGKVYKASSSAWAYRINFLGFAMETVLSGATIHVNTMDIVAEKTGLTAGSDYYLNDTNGTIGTSPGTISRKIGRAITTSRIKRPKNGTPVSAPIARTLSTATVFAHAQLLAFYTNGSSPNKNVVLNGTTLYNSSSSDDISVSLPLLPSDVITCNGDSTSGLAASLVILDR